MTYDELIEMADRLYMPSTSEWAMHPRVASYFVYSLSRRLPYREWKRVWRKGR